MDEIGFVSFGDSMIEFGHYAIFATRKSTQLCDNRARFLFPHMRKGHMTKDEIAAWLKRAMKVTGTRQRGLADAVGLTQDKISKVLNGSRELTASELIEIAQALRVPFPVRRFVPVVGYVGGGAVVYAIDDHEKGAGLDEIDAPSDSGPNAVAVQVRGDSMAGQADDGSYLIYDDRLDEPDPNWVGRMCVVWCEDGRVLVKRLAFGSEPGEWSLVSAGGTIERDVKIKHIARVKWVRPA